MLNYFVAFLNWSSNLKHRVSLSDDICAKKTSAWTLQVLLKQTAGLKIFRMFYFCWNCKAIWIVLTVMEDTVTEVTVFSINWLCVSSVNAVHLIDCQSWTLRTWFYKNMLLVSIVCSDYRIKTAVTEVTCLLCKPIFFCFIIISTRSPLTVRYISLYFPCRGFSSLINVH